MSPSPKKKKTTSSSKPQGSLITTPSNITYLSGFTGSTGFMLLTKSKAYLFTDSRYIQRAKNTIKKKLPIPPRCKIEVIDSTKMWRKPKLLKENWQKLLKKHRIKMLGVEESHLTVAKYKKFKKISKITRQKTQTVNFPPGWKTRFTDISGKIEKCREIKSKEEIKLITKSQRINEKVLSVINKIVQQWCKKKQSSPLTELNLAWKIKKLAHEYGAEDISFEPIVAFGKNSAIPHHLSGNTKLKKGNIILIDMGVKYKGYCSDMTRIIFTSPPTKLQQEIYNTVLKAQTTAIKNIKAGITGKKADSISRKIIKEAGYSEYYQHSGGHGIGLDIHESPSLSENYTKTLKKNSIITVEPGIYLPGKFGIRIEDMILITKKGTKNLTKYSHLIL